MAHWYKWRLWLPGSKLKVPTGFVAVLFFFSVYLSGLWDLYLGASCVIPCICTCNMKIFYITWNFNVTIIGAGNILRDFWLARPHLEEDFLQKHILWHGKFLVAWQNGVLCPFPFVFFNHRDYAIYQRVSDRVATWTWTSVIQVECLRGWLLWLTVTLDFFGHQFLEPDLLTSKQLLDLCLAYTICSCLWKPWREIHAYQTISLKNGKGRGKGILVVCTAVLNSPGFSPGIM